jgi:hypothetical protein
VRFGEAVRLSASAGDPAPVIPLDASAYVFDAV